MKEAISETDLIPESELYGNLKTCFKFDVVSGLPCGELRHFISESANDKEALHIRATNEREAVGVACGSWLAGKNPVLYMQNSGLFEASNDIGSLLIPCKIPALFVVSWRGAPGETATQHLYTGAATIPLLKSFGLPYITEINEKNLLQLQEKMKDSQRPGFLLVKREKFNSPPEINVDNNKTNTNCVIENENEIVTLSRDGALNTIFGLVEPDNAVISSTGLISRSIFQSHDGDNQFYNAGAFGLTSLIGLGFALNRPNVRTVVIEGDGSVLTNLGSLNTISNSKPSNLTHIILDNGVYASCSGETTFGSDKIPLLAKTLGYEKVFRVQSQDGIEDALRKSKQERLTLIDIQTKAQGDRNLKRPLDMAGIAGRFRKKFSKI